MSEPVTPVTVTVKEAANTLGVSVGMIRGAIRDGHLKAFLPGGKDDGRRSGSAGYRIRITDLREWYFGK